MVVPNDGATDAGAAGAGNVGGSGGVAGSSTSGSGGLQSGGSAGAAVGGNAGATTGGTAGTSSGSGGTGGSAGGTTGGIGGSGTGGVGDVIDQSGGTVVASDSSIAGAQVEIPAGALSTPVLISVTPGSDVTTQDARGPAVKFGPDGTTFAAPVNVSVPITDATGQLILIKRNDQTGALQYLENVSISAGILTAKVSSFSTMQAAACVPNGCGGCTPLPSLGLSCGTCGTTLCHPTDPNQTSCDQGLCSFSAVSVGESHTCITRTDGSGSCFGVGTTAGAVQLAAGALPAQRIVAGTNYSCALSPAGTASCWGSGPSNTPSTVFDDLQVGNQWACGLRSSDQGIECWSNSTVTPPAGTGFQSLALSGTAACAINATGAIECFGSFASQIPSGNFTRVRAGDTLFCALTASGQVHCFGGGLTGGLAQFAALSSTTYKDVAIDQEGICLILADDSVECHARQATPIVPPAGSFVSLSGAGLRFCGVRSDNRVECWGDNSYGAAQPLQRRYGEIAVGESAGCGLAAGGALDCWGTTNSGQTPSGTFSEVRAASRYLCARDGTGQVSCFQEAPGTAPAPGAALTSFDVSNANGTTNFGCGLLPDQTISCWGYTGAVIPTGSYLKLSLGGTRLCGIRADETAACYSLANGSQYTTPSGQFSDICTNEGALTCGVRKGTGTLDCWDTSGSPLQIGPGQFLVPPAGTFKRVVCGSQTGNNACALATDDTVHCFGTDASLGQLSAPAGTFSSIDYFRTAACGTRFDGSVSCWGALVRSP